MEFQTLSSLAHTLQTVAIASLIFAVCAVLPKLHFKTQLSKLPAGSKLSGKKQRNEYLTSARKMYLDGYKKFTNSVYSLMNSDGDDTVVVPIKFLPELKKLPDSVLSFPLAVRKLMEVKYTKIVVEGEFVVHSIKSDLTPNLTRLNPVICDEVDAAIAETMPPCDDWTEVHIYPKLVDIVARVSGRIFVGPELCVDPEYLDCARGYTMDIIHSVQKLKTMNPWLKPFMAHRLPEIRTLRAREARCAAYLRPLIEQRIASKKNDPDWVEPDDMLQWMINRAPEAKTEISAEQFAKFQLALIFGAIHTTTMVTTNIFFTLATTPEYLQPLREEIRAAMADNGGKITTRAMQQMEKVDSYMKEVTRFYPPGLTAFSRHVAKGITLSNGQYIPAGVTLEAPAQAIYQDSTHYPDSQTFDGFRHYKLRHSGADASNARNMFVNSNETNLTFGYGRHACPGRFFAAAEIKMMFARLILDYDIKMPDGLTERYPQIEFGTQTVPNPAKPLLFKKAEV